MVTRIRPVVMLLPALSLVLLGACSNGSGSDGYGSGSNSAPTSAAASSAPASGAAQSAPAAADAATLTLAMADSSLGSILVDGNGMTLYLFTNDTPAPSTSQCTGDCLAAWPPLSGQPTAGKGVSKEKLGSFTRTDGSTQATYNGWPLYYFKQDTKPGEVKGQDVNDVWYVIDRDGNKVEGQ